MQVAQAADCISLKDDSGKVIAVHILGTSSVLCRCLCVFGLGWSWNTFVKHHNSGGEFHQNQARVKKNPASDAFTTAVNAALRKTDPLIVPVDVAAIFDWTEQEQDAGFELECELVMCTECWKTRVPTAKPSTPCCKISRVTCRAVAQVRGKKWRIPVAFPRDPNESEALQRSIRGTRAPPSAGIAQELDPGETTSVQTGPSQAARMGLARFLASEVRSSQPVYTGVDQVYAALGQADCNAAGVMDMLSVMAPGATQREQHMQQLGRDILLKGNEKLRELDPTGADCLYGVFAGKRAGTKASVGVDRKTCQSYYYTGLSVILLWEMRRTHTPFSRAVRGAFEKLDNRSTTRESCDEEICQAIVDEMAWLVMPNATLTQVKEQHTALLPLLWARGPVAGVLQHVFLDRLCAVLAAVRFALLVAVIVNYCVSPHSEGGSGGGGGWPKWVEGFGSSALPRNVNLALSRARAQLAEESKGNHDPGLTRSVEATTGLGQYVFTKSGRVIVVSRDFGGAATRLCRQLHTWMTTQVRDAGVDSGVLDVLLGQEELLELNWRLEVIQNKVRCMGEGYEAVSRLACDLAERLSPMQWVEFNAKARAFCAVLVNLDSSLTLREASGAHLMFGPNAGPGTLLVVNEDFPGATTLRVGALSSKHQGTVGLSGVIGVRLSKIAGAIYGVFSSAGVTVYSQTLLESVEEKDRMAVSWLLQSKLGDVNFVPQFNPLLMRNGKLMPLKDLTAEQQGPGLLRPYKGQAFLSTQHMASKLALGQTRLTQFETRKAMCNFTSDVVKWVEEALHNGKIGAKYVDEARRIQDEVRVICGQLPMALGSGGGHSQDTYDTWYRARPEEAHRLLILRCQLKGLLVWGEGGGGGGGEGEGEGGYLDDDYYFGDEWGVGQDGNTYTDENQNSAGSVTPVSQELSGVGLGPGRVRGDVARAARVSLAGAERVRVGAGRGGAGKDIVAGLGVMSPAPPVSVSPAPPVSVSPAPPLSVLPAPPPPVSPAPPPPVSPAPPLSISPAPPLSISPAPPLSISPAPPARQSLLSSTEAGGSLISKHVLDEDQVQVAAAARAGHDVVWTRGCGGGKTWLGLLLASEYTMGVSVFAVPSRALAQAVLQEANQLGVLCESVCNEMMQNGWTPSLSVRVLVCVWDTAFGEAFGKLVGKLKLNRVYFDEIHEVFTGAGFRSIMSQICDVRKLWAGSTPITIQSGTLTQGMADLLVRRMALGPHKLARVGGLFAMNRTRDNVMYAETGSIVNLNTKAPDFAVDAYHRAAGGPGGKAEKRPRSLVKALIICHTVALVDRVRDRFKAEYPQTLILTASRDTEPAEMASVCAALRDEENRNMVVVSTCILGTGINANAVDCVVVLGGFGVVDLVQAWGRVRRGSSGGTVALLHCSNHSIGLAKMKQRPMDDELYTALAEAGLGLGSAGEAGVRGGEAALTGVLGQRSLLKLRNAAASGKCVLQALDDAFNSATGTGQRCNACSTCKGQLQLPELARIGPEPAARAGQGPGAADKDSAWLAEFSRFRVKARLQNGANGCVCCGTPIDNGKYCDFWGCKGAEARVRGIARFRHGTAFAVCKMCFSAGGCRGSRAGCAPKFPTSLGVCRYCGQEDCRVEGRGPDTYCNGLKNYRTVVAVVLAEWRAEFKVAAPGAIMDTAAAFLKWTVEGFFWHGGKAHSNLKRVLWFYWHKVT